MKTEAEAGAMWPQACEWPGPPEARGGGKGPPLEPPEGGGAADPWRQTSGRPQDRESRTGCCGSPAVARGGPRMRRRLKRPHIGGAGARSRCARRAGQGAVPAPAPSLPPPCVFSQSPSRTPGEQVCLWSVAGGYFSAPEGGGPAPPRGTRAQLPRDPLACPSPCAGHRGSPTSPAAARGLHGRPPSARSSMGMPGGEAGKARLRFAPRPSGWGGRRVL